MGLLDLGFSSNKESTNTATNTKTDEEIFQAEKSLTEQLTKETGSTTSLDEETQLFIKSLLGDLSSGNIDANNELLSELTTSIVERSSGAQADVTASIDAITNASRLEGENQLTALQTQLAQQSGGSLGNTLVASSTAVGRASLESQLAKQKGELTLAGRDLVTTELNQALSGASTGQTNQVQNIASLLGILKGSTTEQESVGEASSSSESELNRLLESLTKGTSSSTTKSSSLDFGLQGSN